MSVLFIFFIYEIFSLRLDRPAAEVCDENCGKSKSYAKLTRTDRGWPVGNVERGEAKTLRGCAAYSNWTPLSDSAVASEISKVCL